jgi:hypothetical protein
MKTAPSRKAYVCVYYSGDNTLLDCLVWAYSLRKTETKHDLVVLCRRGIAQWILDALATIFDRVITIDPIEIRQEIYHKEISPRFDGIFDKLTVWALVEYEKIILMDADLYIRQNIDELFELPAPAASFYGRPYAWVTGEKISADQIKRGVDVYGATYLSFGVVVVEPSLVDFNNMLKRLETYNGPELTLPEQEFVRDFYADRWTTISCMYNLRVNTYAWGMPNNFWGSDLNDYRAEDHKVLHYSCQYRPYLLVKFYDLMRSMDYVDDKPGLKALEEYLTCPEKLPKLEEASTGTQRFLAAIGQWLKAYQVVNNFLLHKGITLEGRLDITFNVTEDTKRWVEERKKRGETSRPNLDKKHPLKFPGAARRYPIKATSTRPFTAKHSTSQQKTNTNFRLAKN